MGIAYKGMGMLDDAIRELERAAHDPRFALQAASMLGLCHLEKDDANQAVRWLEKGMKVSGRSENEYQGLRVLLALAYAAAGRLADALALYEEFGRRGVSLADLSEAMRELRAPRGAQLLPFTRTAS
jgi:tetratricopeptide (TPR) repeat protein